MLSDELNRTLTRVGPGTPMGDLLRRYWMPVAGVSELSQPGTKPIRLLGEDLILFRDGQGEFGLIDRRCPHRGADLAFGMVERSGLRCSYHGWHFDASGQCVARPYEDVCAPAGAARGRGVSVRACPVQVKAGMVWAYLGPMPAPLLPDWEPFSWPDGFVQVVISEIPCNWLQCQENSIDPIHFEWMHENWGRRLRTGDTTAAPTHLKVDFEEFEHGFVYRRLRTDTTESDEMWTVGRVCLWPNGFFLGEHFEWRVPIDDENTLSVTWKYTVVPKDRRPYRQPSIPTWHGPIRDDRGRWIDTHVMNQDFVAWVGQGRIADRTRERLGASDRGVVLLRRRLLEEMHRAASGLDPKGVLRDPASNRCIPLPMMGRARLIEGWSVAEILGDPVKRRTYTTYILQAGQPEEVRREFAQAMGIESVAYDGVLHRLPT